MLKGLAIAIGARYLGTSTLEKKKPQADGRLKSEGDPEGLQRGGGVDLNEGTGIFNVLPLEFSLVILKGKLAKARAA